MITAVNILLNLALLFACVHFILLYRAEQRQLVLWYAAGSFFYLLVTLEWVIAGNPIIKDSFIETTNLYGWLQVTGISSLMICLGIENWQDRPKLLRFPFIFTLLPLLLIPTFGFVYDTAFLKELIIGIYEGGTLATAMLLFGFFFSKNTTYLASLTGLSILMLGYIVFWFPGDVVTSNSWIHDIIFICGILTFSLGYSKIRRKTFSGANDDD